MRPCSVRLARRGSRPVFRPSTADPQQWWCQLWPQMRSFNPSLSWQGLLFFLPLGWTLEPVLPVENPVIGIPVAQQWPSKHFKLQIDWTKDHNQVQCFNFLWRNLIFEAECRNVDQERLNVSSFFWLHAVSFGLIQGLWEPVDFSFLPSVRGRLFKCINLWHTLLVSRSFWMLLARATKFSSSSFRTFFTKPFVPPTVNSSFLSKAVNRLLSFNLVPERFHIPDIVYPLCFIHYGEHRFISDSRHIYAFICWQKNLSVKTCPWPLKFFTWVSIYSNFTLSPVTIKLKSFRFSENSLHSPLILVPGFSTMHVFFSFLFSFLCFFS